MKQPNFYAILTANVRYDKRITFRQKVLFAEITALTHAKGYCHASNAYFAVLYDTSPETISRDISNLKKHGYLTIHIDQSKGNERKIFPKTSAAIDETVKRGLDETVKRGLDETVKYNNTSINSTRLINRESAREDLSKEDEKKNSVTEQPSAALPTPDSAPPPSQMMDAPHWLDVAEEMARYFEQDEIGKREWAAQCDRVDCPPYPIDVTRLWAGKNQSRPYVLNNWRKHTGRLTNWIRNEAQAKSKTDNRKKLKSNADIARDTASQAAQHGFEVYEVGKPGQ